MKAMRRARKNRNMQKTITNIIIKVLTVVTAIMFSMFWICLLCIESAIEIGSKLPFILLTVCIVYFAALIGTAYYIADKE